MKNGNAGRDGNIPEKLKATLDHLPIIEGGRNDVYNKREALQADAALCDVRRTVLKAWNDPLFFHPAASQPT